MLSKLWLIPALPLLGFLINGILGLGKRSRTGGTLARPFVYWVACGAVFLSFLASTVAVVELMSLEPESRVVEQTVFDWIPSNLVQTATGATALFDIPWGLQLDPLSGVMILFVTGIGFLIHVYSIGYMWDDDGFYRFFCYLNLFMFMMLTLVLAGNYVVLFVGWEGVGLCSYLLIGFYTHKKSAGDAAKKAFVVNRVGDFGFVLGVFLIFSEFGTLDFTDLFSKIEALHPHPEAAWGALSWIALLLFVGAVGKSAQAPLYVWLPDAMEGPTPVSALIHAATMVTAGVYMVARSTAIYSRAPEVALLVAVVGIFTALWAASIGLFQTDIKKVLAYSTVSQLGYMFTALGVGAVTAGMFHVFTHAFFKALLFLGSGSVIHALHHEQDMRHMGGLRKYLPVTWATMAVGTLAIAGFPPLAGFFSKDEILFSALVSPGGHWVIWLVGLAVAGMTSFYMFRLMFLTFHGQERLSHEAAHHAHESPRSMTVPLMILAAGSAVVGFLGAPAWLGLPNLFDGFLEPALATAWRPEHEAHHALSLEVGLALLSVAVAACGLAVAHHFFLKRPERAEALRVRFAGLHRFIYDKYRIDELYDALFVNRLKDAGSGLSWFDAKIVDGAVNGSALATRVTAWISGQADLQVVDRLVNLAAETVGFFSMVFRRMQTGFMQRYAFFFILGIVLIVSCYLFLGV